MFLELVGFSFFSFLILVIVSIIWQSSKTQINTYGNWIFLLESCCPWKCFDFSVFFGFFFSVFLSDCNLVRCVSICLACFLCFLALINQVPQKEEAARGWGCECVDRWPVFGVSNGLMACSCRFVVADLFNYAKTCLWVLTFYIFFLCIGGVSIYIYVFNFLRMRNSRTTKTTATATCQCRCKKKKKLWITFDKKPTICWAATPLHL